MKLIILIVTFILLQNCSFNKVVKHHGVHNLEKKIEKLTINETNKNDIIKLIGPPSTKSTFNNDLYIYIEKKTSSSKLSKLGGKTLLVNNVLVLEVDSKGLLKSKKLYTKEDMANLKFDKNITEVDYSKDSFINRFLISIKQKIDDPIGKKRSKN